MTFDASRRLAIAVIATVSACYTVMAVVLYLLSTALVHVPVSMSLWALAAGLCIGVVHYLHVRAGLRGEQPPLFPATLVVQVAATYLTDLILPYGWSAVVSPLLAGSLLILLPGRVAWPLVALATGFQFWQLFVATQGYWALTLFYSVTVFSTGTMIYALVRSVRMAEELDRAKAELAEAAVLKERLRISRDLHDGLGRSLTAIALKGDLAARLVERDPVSAKTEVGELVQVAREAVQDVRQVARGYRQMSLPGEVDRAVALLEASGVACQVNLAAAALPRPSEETLAWGVREGVTNILRHSRATTCSISTSVRAGTARLEVVNDGVGAPEPEAVSEAVSAQASAQVSAQASAQVSAGVSAQVSAGNGLTGLGERARQAGGTVTAEPSGPNGFRLTMEVPA
ncbi:sensor histidine kinase [Nonomuraea sp. NPDC059194]|uniref:sensor histidine kinase n=1 Tax=Nonomuraea sp. NPDC059194 TaxID=3346764 RepID=UPI003693AD5C